MVWGAVTISVASCVRLRQSEVIAVEDRTGDLPYLLAGLRLGRLDDPIRRSEAQRRVARIRQLRDR